MARDDETTPGSNELSTPKKVVAGAALGVAIPAAVGVAKKLIGSDDDSEQRDDEGGGREG